MDGLCSPSRCHPGSTGQVYFCSKVVPMGWISATGVIQHVHRRLLTSPLHHLRCLEQAAEVRRDQPLPPEVSRTAVPLVLCCPTRGKVSREAAGQNEPHVGRGTEDSFWQPSIWENPFRVSEVGSAARAVELYAKWLISQKDLLFQLPYLDGKRLLCHCKGSSPCHIDSLIAIWRSHRLPLPSRVRSMWQVYTDNLDMLEVCVTGQICMGSSRQVIMRVLSSREKGANVSKCRALLARWWSGLCRQRPWVTKLVAFKE